MTTTTTTFTLDDGAAKDDHKEETEERREGVVFVDKTYVDGAALEPAVAKPSPRLSTVAS
ncbi:hypothetical protein DAEQUDRAFT_731216 [Daedalea quercina L-15889]|uniref:Uncharacterized protein n=1 Tax=Daedalea quercina L-15889 TaxID=1314783 RepID=A0A165MGI3_9APHY|nr:hypothetical protein DAEQUDRAFT_731216 [Daedalea quercina L-15889]